MSKESKKGWGLGWKVAAGIGGFIALDLAVVAARGALGLHTEGIFYFPGLGMLASWSDLKRKFLPKSAQQIAYEERRAATRAETLARQQAGQPLPKRQPKFNPTVPWAAMTPEERTRTLMEAAY